MKTTINGLYNYFNKSNHLSYVKTITASDDMNKLVEAGRFPIVNIEGIKKAYQDFENFHPDVGQQIVFSIVIQFATRHPEYKTAVLGKTDVKGIWELADDIFAAINDYLDSIRHTTGALTITKKPTIYSRTWVMADKSFMAGGDLGLELSGEIFF